MEKINLSPDPKSSIIILAYDSPQHLIKTVETLRDHTDYLDFEIVISDNSIGTPKEEEIRSLCIDYSGGWENIFYIKNSENLYHGPGCMAGFSIVDKKSKYIVFANDDIFIPASQSYWLKKMVDFMEKDERAASVTPALYSEKETVYWVGKKNPDQPYHDFLHIPRGDERIPIYPTKTCYNNFALILTRRYLVEEIPIGQTCKHYGSDSEFANRIKDKYPDMEHWVIPEIKCYHFNLFAKRFNYGKDKIVDG